MVTLCQAQFLMLFILPGHLIFKHAMKYVPLLFPDLKVGKMKHRLINLFHITEMANNKARIWT